MRSEQTFSIDFLARKCGPKSKEAFIYAKVTVDGGEPAEISLKEKIKHGTWKGDRVVGKTTEVKRINEFIDDVRQKIRAVYRAMLLADQIVTAQSVKTAYLESQGGLKRHTLIELLDKFELVWEAELKPSNMKNYYTTIEYVKAFLQSTSIETGKLLFPNKDVFLPQVTVEFATNLQHFIRTTPIKAEDPCKGNGLAKHMQRFKRIMKWCDEELGWLKPNPIDKFRPWVRKYRRRKKLTIGQVFELEMMKGLSPMLEYVRDLSVFSCYTGLAFADVMQLSPRHLELRDDGSILCLIHRQKSEELTAVPFLQKACEIIRKYWDKGNANDGGSIFPRISNSYVNELLKIIQAALGLDFPLTFHIMRHTFAKTIALKFGIPIEVVQIFLGHIKISTTMIYAEVDDEKVIEDSEGWEEKINKKRELYVAHKENFSIEHALKERSA